MYLSFSDGSWENEATMDSRVGGSGEGGTGEENWKVGVATAARRRRKNTRDMWCWSDFNKGDFNRVE